MVGNDMEGVNQFAIREFKSLQKKLVEFLNKNECSFDSVSYNIDQNTDIQHPKAIDCIDLNIKDNSYLPSPRDRHDEKASFLPAHTFYRLKNRLEAMLIQGHALSSQEATQIATEIGFTVIKGSLTNHSVSKAINICLKLVKENRWRTPNGFYPEG